MVTQLNESVHHVTLNDPHALTILAVKTYDRIAEAIRSARWTFLSITYRWKTANRQF